MARYIPTAAEAPWGGYEVVNAHRPYGQMHMVGAHVGVRVRVRVRVAVHLGGEIARTQP